ncbi:MAG: TerB family tellurite resistance protein [Myxococcota bacterium]
MDEAFSPEELELAFTYHLVNQIVGADGVVAPAEARFVSRTFPPSLLASSGFVGSNGLFTPRWTEALGEALLVLPERSVEARVAIVETLFRAALADDEFLRAEASTIHRAARLLGLEDEAYAELVERLVTTEVDLDSTEG